MMPTCLPRRSHTAAVVLLLAMVLVLLLPIAGCAKKGSPSPPPGAPSTYPRTYPRE